MSDFIIRTLVYSVLPVVLALAYLAIDPSSRTRERRLEVFLLLIFGLSVGTNGLGGFVGHVFASDMVAESIGWPKDSPFQQEMGFANLAVGLLGLVAMTRRDGFREATAIAITTISVGATIVHLMDILETGNLAPGNTIQNLNNLLRPGLVVVFLYLARRAEREESAESHNLIEFEGWRIPRLNLAVAMSIGIGTFFGLGLWLGWPELGALLGVLAGGLLGAIMAALENRRSVNR